MLDEKLSVNFREQRIWDAIVSWNKTLETRVLNPEEPDRYFGDIDVGDIVKFINKNSPFDAIFVKINKVYKRKGFEDMRNAGHDVLEAVWSDKDGFVRIKTLDDFRESRNFTEDYQQRIEKNGIVWRKFDILEKID